MKKKRFLWILMILIIGFIPIVFFGCTSKAENNIELKEITGVLSSNSDLPYVNLAVSDEEIPSQCVIAFQITNYRDEISKEVYFSSDSNAISISNKTYYPNGVVEITINAETGGTALVTATSAQFSKDFTFAVNVLEHITSIEIKNDKNTIYYERGSELVVDLKEYINFLPKTTTERGLIATINGGGKVTPLDDNNRIVLSEISNDCVLSVQSEILTDSASQKINIKVVEKIEEISFQKEVFSSNGQKYDEDFEKDLNKQFVIELLKNNKAKTVEEEIVSYSSRIVKMHIQTTQENLKVSSKVYVKYNSEWIKVDSLVGDIITKFEDGEYISTINFTYEGYEELKYVLSFSYENYVYSETQEIIVKAVEAPNSLTINNVQSLSHSIDVYSKTNNYAGKALKFGVNKNAGKNFLINLYFNEEIGTSKSAQTSDLNGYSNKITLANNETIRVFATGENENSTMLARVYFEFENVEYYFESTINVTIKHNPDNVVIKEVSNLSSVTNSISSYNLDLNTTGIRINENGEQVPNYAQNSKTFYVFGRVNGSLENNHNFTVSSNIACVDVEVDLQTKSFTVTAKSVGTGRFYVTLESGERITFTVNVINSLSELNLSFPTPIQNRNLLETNINGDVYEIIAKTGTMIPVNYSYVGNAGDFNVSGNNLTYSNGNLTCNVDTEGYIYATFSCKSSYLDEQNKIKQITNNIPFKIKFFTPISSFSLSTNKGSNAINLYDLNTVGYYSYNLASVVITVNVDPNGIKEKILPNIVWTHNFEEELELIKIGDIENGDYIDKYSCALYTLEYNKQTGVASVLCNVDRLTLDDDGEYINNLNIVDEDGKLIIDNIILIAQIKGGEGADKYNAANYVSINISENTKVEQIVPSVEEISLDFYKKSIDLSTVIYPLDATNKQLSYTISNNLENLIEIEQTNGVFKISLKGNESDGASGVIRLIAKDSFTKESEYTTFVEIPIQISDGTAEFPYQIITSSDLNILTETGFSKHYQIVGNINASNVNFSNKTFSGVLFGINNATLSGINIISGAEESGSEGSTFNYGFFKEVTGTILNVKFAGKIELTGLVGACNIGLIAGKNSGRLQNVYAEVESISLTTKESGNTAKFNVGGVVGLNAGKILTNIQDGIFTFEGVIKLSLNYNKLADVKDLTFSNYLTTQTFYFGGVAGKSTGIIQVTISDGITEINNNFTSVNINISGKIQANTTAIGGVVGFVEKDTASEITPIISGLKVLGEINCSNNNIGGIAGSSTIDIKNCISRVKITGDENIGGIVGYLNNASVEECKVQNLQNSTILTGNSNIGGIAGIVENNGKIKKSTFISYIKDDSVYDIDVLGDNTNYGRIIGAGTLLGDFNVAIASISATGGNLNIQENKSKTAIFDRIGTGASYFDGGFINELLSDENTIETRYTFTNLQTFIEEIMAYEAEATEGKPKTSFIILPPTKIDLELTQNGLKQQLKNTNDATDETIVFYLINEEKINEETKTLADLTKYISAKANSNTGVIFASSNANILSFKDDGSAQLNGTGLVKITVTSEFNAEIENGFYVYVINNMTDFSAYRKADRMSSQITSATKEVLDKGTTYMLYFKFVEKYNSENFVEPNQINVALKIGDITYYPGDNEDGIRFLKISPEAYQL
ncbi:MAG: hypothetical protein J5779_00630, partial [Clostridia bacterium]|nr:hypothetical protein [Clostridia bacterium]